MPLVFRAVKRTRWNTQKHAEEYKDWLLAGEVPAETLVDVVRQDVQQNELSVYVVNDKGDELKRLVAAFAANRDRPDKLDYKLLDYDQLEILGFDFDSILGDTSDDLVNQWHRNLHHLTIARLMEFVKLLYETETKKSPKKDVEKWIAESVRNQYIQLERIRSETMQQKIRLLREKYQ